MQARMNRHVKELELSVIRKFTAMAKAEPGCLFLTLGEPDFSTPAPIKDAAKLGLDQNLTHYPPSAGEPDLLKRISRFEKEHNHRDYAEDEIIVTIGATEALFVALQGILNPGDEVVVPTPAFGLYASIIQMAGGVFVPLDVSASGFQIDPALLAQKITPRTKAVLLNSPNNPTGVILNRSSLEAVREIAAAKDLFVLCDDVYAQLVYEPGYQSFADFTALRDRILLVQSFSKPYAMTGWRLGYLCADRPVMKELLKLHSYLVVSAPGFLQKGAIAALDYDPKEMAAAYRRRRDYVLGRLAGMGLSCPMPSGAFYVFVDIREFGMDSETFCRRMIKEAKLATVPGSCFGTEGYLRISYCYSDEELSQSLDQLESFIASLRK